MASPAEKVFNPDDICKIKDLARRADLNGLEVKLLHFETTEDKPDGRWAVVPVNGRKKKGLKVKSSNLELVKSSLVPASQQPEVPPTPATDTSEDTMVTPQKAAPDAPAMQEAEAVETPGTVVLSEEDAVEQEASEEVAEAVLDAAEKAVETPAPVTEKVDSESTCDIETPSAAGPPLNLNDECETSKMEKPEESGIEHVCMKSSPEPEEVEKPEEKDAEEATENPSQEVAKSEETGAARVSEEPSPEVEKPKENGVEQMCEKVLSEVETRAEKVVEHACEKLSSQVAEQPALARLFIQFANCFCPMASEASGTGLAGAISTAKASATAA